MRQQWAGGAATYALSTAADQEYECYQGITFPGLYAMMARVHMHRYGTTREQLSAVAAKNHLNGSMNPLAQFQSRVTAEQVAESVLVADPLRILDCSPITDGAAAVVLAPLDLVRKGAKHPLVRVAASSHATDAIALHDRDDLAWLASTEKAAELAYKQAGITTSKLSFCEVHDCFTIAEPMVIEALGLFDRGRAVPPPQRAPPRSTARHRSTPRAGSSRRDIRSVPRASRRSAKRFCNCAAPAAIARSRMRSGA